MLTRLSLYFRASTGFGFAAEAFRGTLALLLMGVNLRASNLAVKGVGSEIRPVRPTNRAELVYEYLLEKLGISRERLENRSEKTPGEIQLTGGSVLELDLNMKSRQRLDEGDSAHFPTW